VGVYRHQSPNTVIEVGSYDLGGGGQGGASDGNTGAQGLVADVR